MRKIYTTPIYSALCDYRDNKPVSFHMPGHKQGRGLWDFFKPDPLEFDITEIPGMDNLHYPQGIIKQSMELAAEAFGAKETFFSVNGSTAGIMAAILSVAARKKLIVQRDCHKSVINAMMLAGTKPVFIWPDWNEGKKVTVSIKSSVIESAILANPDSIGVLITRPNYYGVCGNIKEIADMVHSYGKILIVDEAHGTHLRFSDNLPICALDAGSDICIQSAHKTLPAISQGAYVHVGSDNVDVQKLDQYLRMLQTSSPSYMIMASLDIARDIMQKKGHHMLDGLLEHIDMLKREIYSIDGLSILQSEPQNGFYTDGTRIVINVSETGLSGYEFGHILEHQYGIVIEMSDMFNLVCIASIANTKEDFAKLKYALHDISSKQKKIKTRVVSSFILPMLNVELELSEVMRKNSRRVILENAAGSISYDVITPYPPGIPIICPGELISLDMVDYIKELIKNGVVINGIDKCGMVMVIQQ